MADRGKCKPNDFTRLYNMAWNSGQNGNGANANIRSENQYLTHLGPKAVQTLPNQVACVTQNASGQSSRSVDRLYANQNGKDRYLESLLKAKTDDDLSRLRQTILSIPASCCPSNQVVQNQGPVVSNNVPVKPPSSGGGTYSSQDYASKNIQQRTNYIPQRYANLMSQSLQSMQNSSSRQSQMPSQTFPQMGSYGLPQTQGPQPAQNFVKPPSYVTSRQTHNNASYPSQMVPNVNSTNKAQYDLQNGGANPINPAGYMPSSFVGNGTSDCTQNLQTTLMSGVQMGQVDGSVLVDRSSDCYNANPSNASMPHQPLHGQTIRSALQAQSVQSGQQFPMQVQNYAPQVVQQAVTNSIDNYRMSQLVRYMRSLAPNSKEKGEFCVLLNLYNKVKQNILRMAMEGEQKQQNGQLQANVLPEGANLNSEPEQHLYPLNQAPNANMQTLHVNDGTVSQQNVQQSATFQVAANGNQASVSVSKQLESQSQNSTPTGWHASAQNAYSVSSQQASVNPLSDSYQSFGSTSGGYNANKVRSVRTAVFSNEGTVQQNLRVKFAPINSQHENMSQTQVTHHNNTLASPQLSMRTPNYQNNGNFVPSMGHRAAVSMDSSSVQPHTQKGLLPQPDGFSISPNQSTKAPTLQININLQQSNGQQRNTCLENPVCQTNTNNLLSPITNVPNTDIVSNSLEAIDTCLSMWKMKTLNHAGPGHNSFVEGKPHLVETTTQRDIHDSSDCTAETHVISSDSLIPIPTVASQDVGSSKLTAIVSPLVPSKTMNPTESEKSALTSEPIVMDGGVYNPNEQVNTFKGDLGNVTPGTVHGSFKEQLLKELLAVKCVFDAVRSEEKQTLDSATGDPSLLQKQSVDEPQNEQLIRMLSDESETEQDGSFQISGICSLAEGNSFYDSSVAMIFKDTSLLPEAHSPLSKTEMDMAVDQPESPGIGQTSGSIQPLCTESIEVSLEKPEQTVRDGSLQPAAAYVEFVDETAVQALDAEHNSVEPSEMDKTSLHLESTELPDQLTELLSEFPLGIENYISNPVHEPPSSPVKENLPFVVKVCTLTEPLPELTQILKETWSSGELFLSFKEQLPQTPSMCTLAEELPQTPSICTLAEELPQTPSICTLAEELPQPEPVSMEESVQERVPLAIKEEILEIEEELPEPVSMEESVQERVPVAIKEEILEIDGELPEPVSMEESVQERVPVAIKEEIPQIDRVQSPFLECPWSSDRKSPVEMPVLSREVEGVRTAVEDPKLANQSEGTKFSTTGEQDSPSEERGFESSKKKNSTQMQEFCCLFKWLTHSYGKAPKCSCDEKAAKSAQQPATNSAKDKMPVASPELNSSECLLPTSPENLLVDEEHTKSPSDTKFKASGPREGQPCVMKPREIKPKPSNKEYKQVVPDGVQRIHEQKKPKGLERSERREPKPVFKNDGHVQHDNTESKNCSRAEKPNKQTSDHLTSRKVDKLIIKTDFLKYSKDRHHSKERKSAQLLNAAGERSDGSSSTSQSHDPERRRESSKNSGEKGRPPSPRRPSAERCLKPSSWKPATEKSKPFPSGLDRSLPLKSDDKPYEGQKPRGMPEHWQRRQHSENQGKGQEPAMAPLSPEKDYKRYNHSVKQKVRQSWSGHYVSHIKIKSPVKAFKRSPEQITLAKNYNQFKKEISKSKSSNKHTASTQGGQGRMSSSNKASDPKKSSSKSKDKLYLGPCYTVSNQSPNSIRLAKLEIRSAPDDIGKKRKKSCEQSKPSRTSEKSAESPKMLQFKLCPELLQKSPSVHVRQEEPQAEKEHCRIQSIKSKKEAWYRDLPLKKRRVEGSEEQRDQVYPASSEPTSPAPLPETESTRQFQESKAATFQAFQKMFMEKRSRSLEG
uniref:Uncharacterized protein n=1 Tax=Leptobrachium leishanense TaxID=445787 RepID=A0A8C5MYB2_9ANUR